MKTKIKIIQILSITIIILSFVGIGFTYALQKESSNYLDNSFVKVKDTSIEIKETFNGTTKEEVYFTLDSDIPVKVRAKLIFNFIDNEGNILSSKPIEGEDYLITLNSNWKYIDGYYYLNDSYSSGNLPVLINKLKSLNENNKLSLDILVQTYK